jgi:NADH-quinone oxidoreductase subunit J
MNLEPFILYLFITLSALSAFGIFLVRNVFYGALLLLVCLISLAGIYLMLNAELLAATQIIIYGGGVLVLIIFGIMLTARLAGKNRVVSHQNLFAGSLLAAILFGILLYAFSGLPFPAESPGDTPPMSAVAFSLFTTYAAPFELAGLLLLISLVAAAIIATQIRSKEST